MSSPKRLLFLSGLLLTLVPLSYAQTVKIGTYGQLVHAIREVRHVTEQRIEAAVDEEKVREAWETGKLIDGHIFLHKERANYGEQTVIKLAKDLETSETELKYMLQFARTYPIRPPADELSWAHYRELLSIHDPKEREEITQQASKQHWSRERMRQEIRNRQHRSEIPEKLSEVKPGKVGVYRVVERRGKQYYDLGFSFYSEIKGKKPKQTNPPFEDLFTYNAQVTEVYDGDTFHAQIDVGFGMMTEQRLRLRRIDAPELETRDGKEAKAALEKILARLKGKILIKVFDIDQHGRPLVDVWVQHKPVDQEMLDRGFALKFEE